MEEGEIWKGKREEVGRVRGVKGRKGDGRLWKGE